jgi:hypothetical protein
MRMFAKRFQNGWKPTQHKVVLPTDQTHDFIHVLWILLSQIQNLTKLNKLFNNRMKISTIVFAAMAISSADAYPLLLPTASGAVLVTSKLSCNYRLKLYFVILLSVPMSLMLWLQKTRNASLTTLLPSSFQAMSLAGHSCSPPTTVSQSQVLTTIREANDLCMDDFTDYLSSDTSLVL